MTIHFATRNAYNDDPNQTPYWFASVDGERFIGVSDDPRNHDAKEVAALIEDYLRVREESDGSRWSHIAIMRSYLRQAQATIGSYEG